MTRWRISGVALSLALGAAAVGVVPAAAAAGAAGRAAPTGPTQTAACATVQVGYSTCLVHVWHRAQTTWANVPQRRRRTTPPSPSGSTPSGYGPATIAKAYGFSTAGGTGETIAIVDAFGDTTITSNLSTFDSEYGLPCSSCFSKVSQTGGSTSGLRSTSGWDLEQSLDVEWAHALAPKAHILLVEAKTNSDANLFAAVTYAAKNAAYVSMSWGGSETSSESRDDSYFTKSGVSFFAASGDTHSEVIYPSSSPDVISVGGTTLDVTSTGTWSSESAWSTAGGGCSRYETANPAQASYSTYDQRNATCAGKRAAPDISLDANPNTGVAVYDTVRVTGLSGWIQVGGTSASTVMIASHAAETATQVNAANVYGGSLKIYNVTSGSNGHPCMTGYNLCTGLGSWNTYKGTANTPPAGSLKFTSSTVSVKAGTAAALTISTGASGSATVTITSGSATGTFSTSPAGTYKSSDSLTVTTSGTVFYYKDKKAGSDTLTASASGWTSATKTVSVTAGTVARVAVTPGSVSLGEGATQTFTATAYDAFTNPVTSGVTPAWSTTVPGGKVSPTSGTSTTFTAPSTAATGKVTATADGKSGSATVTVTAQPSMTVTISASSTSRLRRSYQVRLTVAVTGTAGAISGAGVTFDVYDGSCPATGSAMSSSTATTSVRGTAGFSFSTRTTGTYCAEATVTKSGYSTGVATATFSVT